MFGGSDPRPLDLTNVDQLVSRIHNQAHNRFDSDTTSAATVTVVAGVPHAAEETTPNDVRRQFSGHHYDDRPWWHAVATPSAVALAWDEVAEALQQADAYADTWWELDAEERVAKPAAMNAAYSALKAGHAPPDHAPVVNHAERKRTAVASMAASYRLAGEARHRYNRIVHDHAYQWRTDLIQRFGDLQPAKPGTRSSSPTTRGGKPPAHWPSSPRCSVTPTGQAPAVTAATS